MTIRIILAYQCCSTTGPSTTQSQQRWFLDRKGDSRHPRVVFISEFIDEIKKWQEKGDSLVILIDTNENVAEGDLSSVL